MGSYTWQSSRLLWAPCSEDPVAWVGSRPGLDQLFKPAALCLLDSWACPHFPLRRRVGFGGHGLQHSAATLSFAWFHVLGPCATQVLSTQISREPEFGGEAGCEDTASSHSICPCHVSFSMVKHTNTSCMHLNPPEDRHRTLVFFLCSGHLQWTSEFDLLYKI